MLRRSLLLPLALLVPAVGLRAEAPQTLAETGLYSDLPRRILAPGVLPYQPRFPLWTDGLEKGRWILLPPDTAIDATDPDRWQFPVGTRFWKEFALPDRPVETRFLERTADGWSFAAYVWSSDGSEARLAPARGVRGVAEIAPGVRHDVPGRFECAACHDGREVPVLGFTAVQLATGRTDAGAPDLASLADRGLLVGLPARLLEIPAAASAPPSADEAALGYLHGNCSHCHNPQSPLASLDLDLSLPLEATGAPGVIRSGVERATTTAPRAAPAAVRIRAGDPDASQLLQRMATLDPLARMPPLGTRVIDHQAVALLADWIRALAAPAGTPHPAEDSADSELLVVASTTGSSPRNQH